MQKEISLKLKPTEAFNDVVIKEYLSQTLSISSQQITGFYKTKQSIDARSRKQVWMNTSFNVFINEPFQQRKIQKILLQNVGQANKKIIIVGAGPAGLFAALKLIELGIKPIVIERGKDVRNRRRDLAALNKEGIVNPESNYCFGEGGAGTYSDGKLYTRSSKRGDVNRILNLFVQFGADEKILYEAHPHIGTNKLPHIITAMRNAIIEYGGNVLFEKKLIDFVVEKDTIKTIKTADGDTLHADAVILATGHSARDVFELLHNKKILIEAKPFALGVRIEHPQSLIDSIQYHNTERDICLPPSSYSLVEQVNGKGVFSFCMCPGGIIAPAATNANELVVNGWSPSKRNNAFANSGMVVSVDEKDAMQYLKKIENKNKQILSPLTLMYFQQAVERKAFEIGGGKFVAPAQRMVDFSIGKKSVSLPNCSYLPGITSSDLSEVLPNFIYKNLQQGFKAFGNKMKSYYTNEAVVVATESRTSSPVRIPRNAETLEHLQIKNLYPCAEGAGYAGGIVSAAMDGENIARIIAEKYSK
ncbi:MAG: FAD-dependent oxidoreductase [Bacteroidetes bacterium]|nr:FAD-dependent oxidoreductase [Bacteroidota bacterium]MBS1643263.1 FAD-dependent oxidoreductase [Bacteroidota bacterium]MBS1671262.1 FAD-dependent oxidoreductase [Bacteroidota bacterium]